MYRYPFYCGAVFPWPRGAFYIATHIGVNPPPSGDNDVPRNSTPADYAAYLGWAKKSGYSLDNIRHVRTCIVKMGGRSDGASEANYATGSI